MKKMITSWLIIVFTVGAFIFLSACSKSKDSPSASGKYYIRCKVDGKERVFDGMTLGKTTDAGPGFAAYELNLTASKDAQNVGENNFGLVLSSSTPFKEGQVLTQQMIEGYGSQASMVYIDELGSTYISLNDILADDADVKVTITQVAGKEISGTFSGILFSSLLEYAHTITEGSFYLKTE